MHSHKLTTVARERTLRPLTQTELIKSRTHARGRSEHNKAQCRARARRENKLWRYNARVRAGVAF
jgi:hypothetical protein